MEDINAHACKHCSKPADFMTPVGKLCAEHALYETIYQELSSEKWLPVLLRVPAR